MSAVAVSEDMAYETVYDAAASALSRAAGIYHGMLKVSSFVADKLTDNVVSRFTGAAYYARSVHAMLGAGKDVNVGHLAEIVRDPGKSFGEKLKASASHIAEKFSHEATVGGAAFFGKAAVIAPVAIGFAALVSLASPVALGTAGLIAVAGAADVAMTKAATYYLATHAGHGVEASLAEKVARGQGMIKGLFGATRGQDPSCKAMAEMGDRMEAAAKEHGHSHHHEGFFKTLGKDLMTVVRVDKYPEKISNFAKDMVKESASLYNHFFGKDKAPEQAAAPQKPAPDRSRFVQTFAAVPDKTGPIIPDRILPVGPRKPAGPGG